MAKNFISFLGTGGYQECVYSFKDILGKKVIYIQDTLIDFLCKDFDKDDKITIFLTSQAKEKHWNNLKTIIENKNCRERKE